MTDVWPRAALWLGLGLAATRSIRPRVATALSEIVVATVAQLPIGASSGTELLGTAESWITCGIHELRPPVVANAFFVPHYGAFVRGQPAGTSDGGRNPGRHRACHATL
jgi:hypothetical protein